MGYKRGWVFGTDDGLIWSKKYRIARYHDDRHFPSFFEKGCVCFFVSSLITRKKGFKNGHSGGIGAYKTNILRKISFDIDKRDIIIESRNLDKKRFKKVIMNDITNKDFFNYVRKHVEDLFGILYEVTPNKDRTVFKLVKRDSR